MPNEYPSVRERLNRKLHDRLRTLPDLAQAPLPAELVERPRDPTHGDYATSAALALANVLRKPPREIAAFMRPLFEGDPDFSEVSVAGPGFLNFRISRDLWRAALRESLLQGEAFGDWPIGEGRRILIEYVSANPTGPLNIVNARAAAVGSALVKLLSKVGFEVSGEYYVNDHGRQARLLGESLAVHFRRLHGQPQAALPEEGYPGDYLTEIARGLSEAEGRRLLDLGDAGIQRFADLAIDAIMPMQTQTLRRYGVEFDLWFRESVLHDASRGKSGVEAAAEELARRGLVFERDGARWFRPRGGDEESENVLFRSDGTPTYAMGDIAYHLNKRDRGFDHAINILGPDHHGAVPRLMDALRDLGLDGFLEALIVQQVSLIRDGQPVKVSKRRGEFITLDELIDEVGVDAAKFFFLLRRADSHLDFDLSLARLASSENPVYYVQYAHARICSIVRYAGRDREVDDAFVSDARLERLEEPAEFDLMKQVLDFPEVVRGAAMGREVQRLPHYLRDVAQSFHRFYDTCRVVSDDAELTQARLVLAEASRRALAYTLGLMGVSAPERM